MLPSFCFFSLWLEAPFGHHKFLATAETFLFVELVFVYNHNFRRIKKTFHYVRGQVTSFPRLTSNSACLWMSSALCRLRINSASLATRTRWSFMVWLSNLSKRRESERHDHLDTFNIHQQSTFKLVLVDSCNECFFLFFQVQNVCFNIGRKLWWPAEEQPWNSCKMSKKNREKWAENLIVKQKQTRYIPSQGDRC